MVDDAGGAVRGGRQAPVGVQPRQPMPRVGLVVGFDLNQLQVDPDLRGRLCFRWRAVLAEELERSKRNGQ